MREKIKKSYRHVDAVLDTTSFWRLPELILGLLEGDERAAEINTVGGVVEPDTALRRVCLFRGCTRTKHGYQ